jgi:hypothetical protein
VDDRLEVQLLGGEQRKALVEGKPHLIPKNGNCSGSGPVMLFHAVGEDVFHQIEILTHRSLKSLTTQKMGKFTAGGNRWLVFINGRNPHGFAARGCPGFATITTSLLGEMP